MKSDVRQKYKIKRKYFQHSAREVADGAIRDTVLQAFSPYESFFVYFSYGSEADTHALIEQLVRLGKKVYLPRVSGKDMEMVAYDKSSRLYENAMGISEPEGQAFAGEPDICLAPLLAVNSKGYRLGCGGGYYDRFFEKHTNILKVGIGYALQYTDEFEEDGGDYPLDLFISERGIIDFGRRN